MGRGNQEGAHRPFPHPPKNPQQSQLGIRYMGFMLLFFNLMLLFLSLHNKLPQHSAAKTLINIYDLIQFLCRAGNQEQLSWVVLTWGLAWHCSRDINWSHHHLKAWLGQRICFWEGLLPWLLQEALVPYQESLSLEHLSVLMTWQPASLPSEWEGSCSLTSLWSHTPPLPQ